MATDDLLKELVLNSYEIIRWLRFQNIPKLKELLKDTLMTLEKWQVYELADGSMSLRKIVSETGVALTTVQRWLKVWWRLGIVDKVGDKYVGIISPADLGIPIPKEREASK